MRVLLSLIAALLLTVSAQAQVVVDATSFGSHPIGAGGTMTSSHTISAAANRLLIVHVVAYEVSGNSNVAPVTYGAASLTEIGVDRMGINGVGAMEARIWALVAPVTGTDTITVNFSAGGTNPILFTAISFTGVDQTTPYAGPAFSLLKDSLIDIGPVNWPSPANPATLPEHARHPGGDLVLVMGGFAAGTGGNPGFPSVPIVPSSATLQVSVSIAAFSTAMSGLATMPVAITNQQAVMQANIRSLGATSILVIRNSGGLISGT